jgi:hypothetical protein
MWIYKEKQMESLEDFPEGAFGFVYKITNKIDGRFYIGRKNLRSELNIKLGKKELAVLSELKKPGKKPSKKKVIKESDWKTYYGSEPELKKDVKELGSDIFFREIIHIAMSKKELTYSEIKYQFKLEVLENKNTYNSNIEGRYFKSDFIKKDLVD